MVLYTKETGSLLEEICPFDEIFDTAALKGRANPTLLRAQAL
jgi:hypothetical protein